MIKGGRLMPSMTVGKITAGITGMTGVGSLGVTTTAVAGIASARAVPDGMWAVLALLSMATALVAGLGLVLDYECAKVALREQAGTARLRADLERDRKPRNRVMHGGYGPSGGNANVAINVAREIVSELDPFPPRSL
jgi:hypothetical protein